MGRVSPRFLTLLVLSLSGTWPATGAWAAARQTLAPAGDGCAQLAAELGRSLQGAYRRYRLDAPHSSRQFMVAAQIVDGGPVSCGTTAAVTSAAFSSAMTAYGLQLDWNNGGPGNRVDHCLGHIISECYPELSQGGLAFTAADNDFVRDAWYAVQRGVTQHMPFGPQSDLVYFRPNLIAVTLQVSLDASLAPSPRPDRRSLASGEVASTSR